MKQQLASIGIISGIIFCPVVVFSQPASNSSSVSRDKLTITQISHNIQDSTIATGETLTITLKGTPGVQASVLLLGDKQQVREYKAQETNPGVYVSQIQLTQRDRVTEGVILARLQQGSQVVYRAIEQAFSVVPGTGNRATSPQPQMPTSDTSVAATSQIPLEFTSHQNQQQIEKGGLTIQGKTEPNAEIKIKITSNLPLIEGVIGIEGDTLIDRTIDADGEGIFRIAVPQNPNAPKGLKYEIIAIALSKSSQSKPVKLTLIQK